MNTKNNKEIIEDQVNIWNQAASSALADGQIDPEEMEKLRSSLKNLPFELTAKNKKEMTESHLNMWKLVASAVHADGRVDPEEIQMVKKYIEELHFDARQKEIIKNELRSPTPPEQILPKITDPGDRSQSLYFVRLLLWKDNKLTDTEQAFLKKVSDYLMQFADIQELSHQLELSKQKTSMTEALLYSMKSSVVQFLKRFTFFFKE